MRVVTIRSCLISVALALLGCGDQGAGRLPDDSRIAPELDGGLTWLNSTPLRLAELRGKVVLLDFFEYSCINCIRTFPYLQEWQRRYADAGLVIIGVHTPQYGFSMDPQHVFAGVQRFGLTYPIVVDSNFAIAEAYRNRYWPRKFLLDKDGRIRFDHIGEGAYEKTELMIQQLLGEIDPDRRFPPPMPPVREVDKPGAVCFPITPELYLGHLRGRLGNGEGVVSNAPAMFRLPDTLEEGKVYAAGQWTNHSEYLRHARDTEGLSDFILLRYRAAEVNVVMKPEDIYWMRVFVQQNGDWLRKEIAGADIVYDEHGRSYVEVKSPRMYNLVAGQAYGSYELRLYVQSRGLSVYSFSFGTCVIPADVDRLTAGANQS